MSKFTKGPWRFVPEDGATLAHIRQADLSGATVIVLPQSSFHAPAVADMNLIAAAPDMYEALEAAIECGMVPVSSTSEGGASRHSRQVQVADMIRAALAKATGNEE